MNDTIRIVNNIKLYSKKRITLNYKHKKYDKNYTACFSYNFMFTTESINKNIPLIKDQKKYYKI